MKKFLIGLAVAAISVTGLSINTASATSLEVIGGEQTSIVINCSTDLPRNVKPSDVTAYAKSLYSEVFTSLAGAVDSSGNIDLNGPAVGGLVHVAFTGDATGGTITVTDEGTVILSASLSNTAFSFNASATIGDYLAINVSFYKDRLGNLCGPQPFTVCLSNTTYLVEAADLAKYLKTNPTAVVVSATVGCPGPAGPSGSDGKNGSNGSNGAVGVAGPAGPAGQTVVVEKTVTVQAPAPVVLPRTL